MWESWEDGKSRQEWKDKERKRSGENEEITLTREEKCGKDGEVTRWTGWYTQRLQEKGWLNYQKMAATQNELQSTRGGIKK